MLVKLRDSIFRDDLRHLMLAFPLVRKSQVRADEVRHLTPGMVTLVGARSFRRDGDGAVQTRIRSSALL